MLPSRKANSYMLDRGRLLQAIAESSAGVRRDKKAIHPDQCFSHIPVQRQLPSRKINTYRISAVYTFNKSRFKNYIQRVQ